MRSAASSEVCSVAAVQKGIDMGQKFWSKDQGAIQAMTYQMHSRGTSTGIPGIRPISNPALTHLSHRRTYSPNKGEPKGSPQLLKGRKGSALGAAFKAAYLAGESPAPGIVYLPG
jgi:hypothetical protein